MHLYSSFENILHPTRLRFKRKTCGKLLVQKKRLANQSNLSTLSFHLFSYHGSLRVTATMNCY